MDYQRLLELLDLTEDILVFRGGPTSGNWGHGGRKGKKGGSGRGGGFRRVGVRDGKKTGRKGIKRASRQTRGKDERAKGGGAPERGKAIPAGVVGRAKGNVAKAKKVRDKDLKAARKSSVEVEKSRAASMKARLAFFKSSDKSHAAFKKSNDAYEKSDKVLDFLNTEPNFSDPKVKAKVDKMQKQSEIARKRADKAADVFRAADKKTNEARAKSEGMDQRHDALLAKAKGVKKSRDVQRAFQKDTEAASKIMFQNNLNEAKDVRSQIKKTSTPRKSIQSELDKTQKAADDAFQKNEDFAKKFGSNSPQARRAVNEAFDLSGKVAKLRQSQDALKIQEKKAATELLKVNNPTKLTQAPGSEKDKVFNPALNDRRKKGQEAFQDLVSDDVVLKGSLVQYKNTNETRSFQVSNAISEIHMSVFSGPDTVIHELGHTAENYNPRLLRRSIEFRDKRTTGEAEQKLADVDPKGRRFGDNEVGKPDKFIDVYMGKDYGPRASEVFSMGIEEMSRDPIGFAEKDPEMFDFIYAQARTP